RIEATPPFVAPEHIDRAEIQTETRSIEHCFGESGRVLEPKVEALPRDGVDAMRGISRQRKAFTHIRPGKMELERIGPAWPGRMRPAEMSAEAPRDLGVEL